METSLYYSPYNTIQTETSIEIERIKTLLEYCHHSLQDSGFMYGTRVTAGLDFIRYFSDQSEVFCAKI